MKTPMFPIKIQCTSKFRQVQSKIIKWSKSKWKHSSFHKFNIPLFLFFFRLHLVLIKSKLDELRSAQPLILFPFSSNAIQSTTKTSIPNVNFHRFLFVDLINDEQLTPKALIDRYKLEKSHIAFTLCSKLLDDSYEIHSDTTVLSSVITEFNASATTKTNSQTGQFLLTMFNGRISSL